MIFLVSYKGEHLVGEGYVVWLDARCPADAADHWPLQPRVGCIHIPSVIQTDGWGDLFWDKKDHGGPGLLGTLTQASFLHHTPSLCM